ncbi:MAG: type I-E CRISPR-associated protein Cas6/Cse3/CasE [Corynebacterium sp.]|nr:type I-E CRISPR-associated protein Cas6/Cse3/CasE [Corynebacterium sp.]
MTNTVFLTKAPAHSLLQTARQASAKVNANSLDSPTFRHRAVMGLFPSFDDANPRSRANILFRLETPATEAPYFLIQSSIEPAQDETGEIVTKEVETALPEVGSTVVFRIAVNAIRRESFTNASGKRSYRITPVPADHEETELNTISTWLSNKLSPAFAELEITNHRRNVLSDGRSHSMTVQVDSIDGVATVGDSTALAAALRDGVGREKAYGCGLLTIRPLV